MTEDPAAAGSAAHRRLLGAPVWQTAVVGGSLLALTVAHFSTDPQAHEVHNLLFKATYVPLVLAGLWFGVRGAVVWSGLTSGAYLIHLLGQLSGHHPLWAGIADLVLYNFVTLTTAVLSQRRAQALARAERHARALEENARALLRAEEIAQRSERLSALGQLAAGMAHELRNPLGGIRGAGEVLRRPDADTAAREEFGALLEEEIARLDQVVANFLDFARPRSAEIVSVHPAETVDAVLLLLGAEARRHGVQLESGVPPSLVVRADADLLRQVLLNLALNAVQAQPDGGAVRVRGTRDEAGVHLDVVDRGRGVPESVRGQIFDPYVTGRPEGTGLGLAIAARIATTLGGELTLHETGAGGTTFRLTLPA